MPTGAIVTPAARTPLAALRGVQLSIEAAQFNQHIISTVSVAAIGTELNGTQSPAFASNTYPSANRALACQFVIGAPFLVRKVFWLNGATVTTDSIDVGVYTDAGARVVSGGGTAASGANVCQEVDVTDTILKPGRYWLAYAQNGVTVTPVMAGQTAALLRVIGCAQMDTAYVLPSTFTPAAVSGVGIPLMGIASRTVAA